MAVKQTPLFVEYVKIGAVVAAYWVISISMVFLNAHLLSDKNDKLDAPLFITFYQCLVSIAMCILLSLLTQIFPGTFSFPRTDIDYEKLKKLVPLSVSFVGMITFNNLCLKHVGVAFYTVSRSLTTVFNVIFTYVILKQSTSSRALLCCGIIVSGFILGVDQEGVAGSLSVIGVLFGLSASAILSLYSIYTKRLLPLVDESVSKLTFYNNVNAALMFIPLMLVFGEFEVVLKYDKLFTLRFWTLMTITGVCGFLIAYVTMLQIQVTSPLTHNVSGTAKACAQTVLAVIWFSEVKSFLWWISNAMVLVGSAAYTRVRQLEMVKKSKEAQIPPTEDKKRLITNV